jgi:hypothetical protein
VWYLYKMEPSKKSEYNRRAYEKKKGSVEIKSEDDKYKNKYKELKKENETLKLQVIELQIEAKYLKIQLEKQPTPQAIQPIVQVLPPAKQLKNKTKIEEFRNAIPINQFFSEIKIDCNDIRTLKNIRGDSVTEKFVNFIHDVIKKRYDEIQEDQKPFYCSDKRRKTLHFKQNDFANKKVVKDVLTKQQMISNGFNLYNYTDCLNEDGEYEFFINERCYDINSKWMLFHENENTDNLFYYISRLIKLVIGNYPNAIHDLKQMSCDENTDDAEISPLKILTTSLKDNFNKIIKVLCDISYFDYIEG